MRSMLVFVLVFQLLYIATNASSLSKSSSNRVEINNEAQSENSDESSTDADLSDEESQSYFTADSIILSGIFDRLHNGHKLFFTEAIRRANKRVVICVHDGNAIRSNSIFNSKFVAFEFQEQFHLFFSSDIA